MLGLILVVAAFTAIGLYMSSLTEQPTVAAVTTFGLLLLLWIVDWAGGSDIRGGNALAQLSMLRHYEPLLKGLFNSADVAYYLLLVMLFTGFTIRRMDAARLQH
jgi:ABC-2 type transport system permease protein